MRACPTCGKKYLGDEEFCPQDGATLVDMEDTGETDALIGTTVDNRYKIEKKIGEGGMGIVYLATHAVIGKKYAVKVLSVQNTGESEVAQRFVQEARSAAAIGNEHIIEITDFGQLPDDTAYFVMEFLDGQSLQAAVEGPEKLSIDRVLHILIQSCEALSAAHSANIVHRDLKPDNVFLIEKNSDVDFVKVLDFGIAKVARESGRLTRTGMIFGTPQYMSPEQAAGTNMDARTDIYSLGIIMYEMLTGHVPFEADTFMGVLTKHLYEEPIPPRRLVPPIDVPAVMESVLLKAIAKKPEKRYQSMDEFKQDLIAIQDGKTPAIVYNQMRESTYSTVPPTPSDIVGGEKRRIADSIGEEISPKRNRKPLFAVIGVLIAAGVLAGIFFASRGGDDSEKNASAKGVVAGPAAADAAKASQAKTEPATDADKQPAKDADKQPAGVQVTSKPQGASIYKNGALVGKLPIQLNRPDRGSGDIKYQLRFSGYNPQDIIITRNTPENFEVAMTKIETKPVKSGKKSSSSSSRRKKRKKKSRSSSSGGDLADPWAQ